MGRLVASSCRQKILEVLSRLGQTHMMDLVRRVNSTYTKVNRNLKTTESHIHPKEATYGNEGNDNFVCEIFRMAEEAKKLIAKGYEFVNEINGEYLYRKREYL